MTVNDGHPPWIEHFYLAHGIGTDSAEMPLVGTDLGEAFDALRDHGARAWSWCFEPVIWDDGFAGLPVRGRRGRDRPRVGGPADLRYDPFEGERPW